MSDNRRQFSMRDLFVVMTISVIAAAVTGYLLSIEYGHY
jgi:hypothetical protein